MKKFMVPAILLSAILAGTSYGGGLLSDNEDMVDPSSRYPVAWANRQVADSAQYAGYPGYAYAGFAAPMYMTSWGKSPCGPDCGSVWAGYKTCHEGGLKGGWGGGCGFGGCGQGYCGKGGCGFGGCGKGRCDRGGCGFGHAGFGACDSGCQSCAPQAVGCCPSCGPKFNFNFNCKPKCKAKCRPKCDKCCGLGFGGRPRCGLSSCGGCGCFSGCAGDIDECDFTGHADAGPEGDYYESMPGDVVQPEGQDDSQSVEPTPAEDVPPPPLEARLWRGLSTLSAILPVNFSQN